MNDVESMLPEIALAAALAWGAGVRLYAVLFMLGLAGRLGWFELPDHLSLLQNPMVLAASGFMTFVEFFADKIPWVDSLWDMLHTFIRIPAGAALAASVFGASSDATLLATAVLGGTLAAGSHFTKAGARGLINTSPEPFSNWAASLAEDAMVPAGLWLALSHPLAFLAAFAMLLFGACLVAAWIVRGLAGVLGRLRAAG